MPSLTNAVVTLFALVLWVGCVPVQLVNKINALEERNRALEQRYTENTIAVQRLAAQLETLDRSIWSEKLCKSSKYSTQIAEFIGQVQAAVPEVCNVTSLENSLIFLRTQAYANAFFRPTERVSAMHIARREYLLDLLAPRNIHPSTRLLVLVQPAEETSAASQAALALGENFITMIREEIAPHQALRILGPHLLPCRVRKEIQRIFNGPMDATIATEPKDGTPRIRIWVFLTNC